LDLLAQGLVFAAQGLVLAAQGLVLAAQGLVLAAQGLVFAAQGLVFAAQGLVFAAQGFFLAAQGLVLAAQGAFSVVAVPLVGVLAPQGLAPQPTTKPIPIVLAIANCVKYCRRIYISSEELSILTN
jgi:hypothetical protein